jgi:hypothetical protein
MREGPHFVIVIVSKFLWQEMSRYVTMSWTRRIRTPQWNMIGGSCDVVYFCDTCSCMIWTLTRNLNFDWQSFLKVSGLFVDIIWLRDFGWAWYGNLAFSDLACVRECLLDCSPRIHLWCNKTITSVFLLPQKSHEWWCYIYPMPQKLPKNNF